MNRNNSYVSTNNSFLSNHQLIEGIKHRSSRSLKNKTPQTNITLIPTKIYHHASKQNYNSNVSPPEQQNLLQQLSKCVQNKQLLTKVEQLVQKNGLQKNSKETEGLLKKIEKLYVEKNRLKHEKKILENRLAQQNNEADEKEHKLKKQVQKLRKIVLKQSQIINTRISPSSELQANIQELHRMVFIQAKSCQQEFYLHEGAQILLQ